MRRAGVLMAGIAVALWAQWCLDRRQLEVGLLAATVAALLCGLAMRNAATPDPRPAPPAPWSGRRCMVVAAGAALAVVGTGLMAPNASTPLPTVLWLLGLGVAVAGLGGDGSGPSTRSLRSLLGVSGGKRTGNRSRPGTWLALAAILVAAVALRFHHLADLPAEAGCDVPLKLWIVRGILDGERPIFSTVFPGREVGFFYLTALYGAVFGADQFALKAVSAAVSVATVAALFALGRRWCGPAVGLLAAAWLALSPWHLAISRIGYRGVLTPLMVAAALLTLDRALARGARRDWVRLGLVIGACGYTYTASLAIPVAVGGVWAATAAGRGRGWAAALVVALLTALPLLRVAAADPALVGGRAVSRLERLPADDVGQRLLVNALRSAGMFNLRGDAIATQNVAFRRQFGLVSGALFLCGLGIAAAGWRHRRGALLLWFLLVTQVPSALALGFPGEVPGALRASGGLIPAYLLAALPLPLLGRTLPRRRWAAALVGLATAALLLAEARETWRRYFVEYPAGLPFANYPLSRTIAAAMDDYAGRGPVYLPGYPYWLDGNALRIQLARLPLAELREMPLDQVDAALAAAAPPFMVVLRADDETRLALLRRRFADARAVRFANAAGEPMFVAVTTP